MLVIENVRHCVPVLSKINNVHGFYRDSIRQLFGIDVDMEQAFMPTRNHKTLLDLMIKVTEESRKNILYYFDIRFCEELGGIAPQYELLYDLGLKRTQPICIKSTSGNALNEGLFLCNLLLKENETALFSVSRLASAEWQLAECEFAMAFTATSDGVEDKNILIKGILI